MYWNLPSPYLTWIYPKETILLIRIIVIILLYLNIQTIVTFDPIILHKLRL